MTNTDDSEQESSKLQNWLLLLYLLFVVYGSLVPLQYVDRSWHGAIEAFRNIPFLTLGIDSRADWIANGVLYVPVGFLTAQFLRRRFKDLPIAALLAFAGVFSMALAVAVEFAQMFFPQRTVSLNDLLAECLGSLVGLALWARYAPWFSNMMAALGYSPQRLAALALDGYVFAYLAFALFPYDFLVSWPELAARADSDSWGWLLAGHAPRPLLLGLHLLAEVGLTLPFGLLLARRAAFGLAGYKQAVLIGLMLGGAVETLQFLMASGVAQGLSVLTRVAGVCGGLALSRYGHRRTPEQVALTLRRYTFALAAAYLALLFELNGWFTSRWHGLDSAMVQLAQVKFMPFYYHYFTTEALALLSLGVVAMSYTPVAVLAWAHRRSSAGAAVVASVLAMGIESGKLFIDGRRPDPTNILLACAASWLTLRFLQRLSHFQSVSAGPMRAPRPWLLLCLAATGIWLANFPAFPVLVGGVLITCAVMVWQRPAWVFAIIPAALPVFDLAPWSGRFFFDEFDALMLLSLAIAYSRVPARPLARSRADVLFNLAATLVVLSFAISAVRGMLPFQLLDANSFNNYYSPYNALRIVKGVAFALAAYGLLKRLAVHGIDARRQFGFGMAIGLGLTVGVILWERAAFSGLWNFSGSYRVTGPFSAMHTGGAYIECFLAAATPFLVVLMLGTAHRALRLACFLLVLATTYALMVTFSRNGFAAFAVAVGAVLLTETIKAKRLVRRSMLFAGMTGAMFLVALPVFLGDFAQSRMATVNADLGVRQSHWEDVVSMRDSNWATSVFGMGLGRYPETSYWRSTSNPRSGTYRLAAEADNPYVRLGAGDAIYLEQWVSMEPGKRYVLKLDVRSSGPGATITVPICEKWMLTAYNCIWQSFDLGQEFGSWRSLEAKVAAKDMSISPWYSRRTTKLSLYYETPQSILDIDNVRLETESGENLISNGDFTQGLDHWFFSTDGHLQWHIKSLFVGLLFDQGWFGLVAMSTFLLVALRRAATNVLKGDADASAGLAALCGFLVVGLFDTLIDSPRFLMLLFLLTFIAAARPVLRPAPDRLH